jgi:meiotically up-regulated gene 157 (Mug157) protein
VCTRRTFLASAGAAFGALAADSTFPSRRPARADRKFVSQAVEAKIAEMKRFIADPELAWLFENCFPNTLDTTVRAGTLDGKPDTFVITGDIDAMWLRDSTAQVWPYLPLTRDDKELKTLIAGVIHRQTRCILIDPYANAFYYGPAKSPWLGDRTEMKPEVHERKWEIDSLCSPIRLAHGYWKTTGDASCFDSSWRSATALIVKTFRAQQRKNGDGPYSFQRVTESPADSLPAGGYGNHTRPCGLIHSGFRPSDDACIYPFLIPSNLFAVTVLERLSEIYAAEMSGNAFARECRDLADEVRHAVERHGIAEHGKHGRIFAYEVDGFGNRLFMDDANVPSLLSLPYTESCAPDEPLYRSTRAFVMSDDDPYYYRGSAASGLGGPHSGLNMIWPLGIIIAAITSQQESEIASCLATLKATHAGTGFMHESFCKDDPARFTRTWFAWANTMFGELILKIRDSYPQLLRAQAGR